ncbi:MAG TPA: hypothetical protein PK335_11325 [Draconibacterium sp.]|nr:hypothetical protein [Draconibacterium sp.]
MDKQNENVGFPKWIIVNILTALLFSVFLVVYTFQKIHNEWVEFACWFLIVVLLLLPAGMGILFYLRIKAHHNSQRLEFKRIEKQKALEKHLADLHHEYRLRALQNEIRLKELENEKLRIEKGNLEKPDKRSKD